MLRNSSCSRVYPVPSFCVWGYCDQTIWLFSDQSPSVHPMLNAAGLHLREESHRLRSAEQQPSPETWWSDWFRIRNLFWRALVKKNDRLICLIVRFSSPHCDTAISIISLANWYQHRRPLSREYKHDCSPSKNQQNVKRGSPRIIIHFHCIQIWIIYL